jgi:threonine dehydrogenase-like Zn-dependent dehydrogenase
VAAAWFVFAYDAGEFAETLRAIADGAMDVAPLITGKVGLDGVDDAFTSLSRPDEQCKILVRL